MATQRKPYPDRDAYQIRADSQREARARDIRKQVDKEMRAERRRAMKRFNS